MRFRFWNSGFFYFSNFLSVGWLRILLTYLRAIFVNVVYSAIFGLMNTTPLEHITFSHFVFSLNGTGNQPSWDLYQKKISSQLMSYMAWLFCGTIFKRQLRPTNHSRILILARLVGASAATNIVMLTFYCISEDNLELKLSWAVDIKGFKD